VEDVFERVRAMPVVLDLLPPEPGGGSPFDQDASLLHLATYDVVGTRLQDAVARLLVAGVSPTRRPRAATAPISTIRQAC
jgi:hypothetical protein